MKMWIRKALGLLLLAVIFIAAPARADNTPESLVRGLYDQLITSMKQGNELGFGGRYKKIDPVIRTAFNLPLMARLSVGTSWGSASLEEQANLIDAFSAFSISTYASRFASYDGEQFTVLGQKKTANGIVVETTIKPKNSDAVSLNYLLRPDEKGVYRIVDVFLNGTISELATRRAEFSSIARREGISALLNSLGQKSKQLDPS